MKNPPLIRFRIDFAENANVGPGKIALLEAIRTHGSLSAAARAMKISYRRAWLLLESLNRAFMDPVSVNSVGGSGGGGTQITPFGILLVKRYREVEQRFSELGQEYFDDIRSRIKSQDQVLAKRISLSKKSTGKGPSDPQ